MEQAVSHALAARVAEEGWLADDPLIPAEVHGGGGLISRSHDGFFGFFMTAFCAAFE